MISANGTILKMTFDFGIFKTIFHQRHGKKKFFQLIGSNLDEYVRPRKWFSIPKKKQPSQLVQSRVVAVGESPFSWTSRKNAYFFLPAANLKTILHQNRLRNSDHISIMIFSTHFSTFLMWNIANFSAFTPVDGIERNLVFE